MAPMTRKRLFTLKSAVLEHEDLLDCVLGLVSVRDLEAASCVCRAWRACSVTAFRAWRNRPGLYLVGGCDGGAHPASAHARRSVVRYDDRGDEWIPVAQMLKARDHHAVVACDGALYALGGWSGSRNRASCERYLPREDRWTLMVRQRLRTARSGHGAAVSDDGRIYALAGWGGAQAGFLSSIEECATPATRADAAGEGGSPWRAPASASLHLARHCPATASIGRHVYVVGGSGTSAEEASLGAQPTASVERLDTTRIDAGWRTDLAPMLYPRYRHAMTALQGMLYSTGGQTPDGRATASVERYDPKADAWVELPPMNRARFSHAACSLGGKLYVVGGFASGEWLTAIERYDPATRRWENLSDLSSPISAPGLAVC